EPASLEGLGGIEGIGQRFLNNIASRLENDAKFRDLHQSFTPLLSELLPDAGVPLKKTGQSTSHLASRLQTTRENLEPLLVYLDREERLIAPAGEKERDWQLSHDFFVSPVREWVHRDQQKTFRGRLSVRKSDQTAIWNSRGRRREFLPGWLSWIQFLGVRNGCAAEKDMMRAANRFHVPLSLLGLGILCLAFFFTWQNRSRHRAALLANTVAHTDDPHLLEESLTRIRESSSPILTDAILAEDDSLGKTLAISALKANGSLDGKKVPNVSTVDLFRQASPSMIPILGKYYSGTRSSVEEMAMDPENDPQIRLAAAGLLATPEWHNSEWWQSGGSKTVTKLIIPIPPTTAAPWGPIFRHCSESLVPPLYETFLDSEDLTESLTATHLLHFFLTSSQSDGGSKPTIGDLIVQSKHHQFSYLSSVLDGPQFIPEAKNRLDRLPHDEKRIHAYTRFSVMLADHGQTAPLINTWHSGDPDLRSSIVFSWRKLGMKRAIPLDFLRDRSLSPLVHYASLLTLGEFPNLENYDDVTRHALDQTNAGVAQAAGWLLKHHNQPRPFPTNSRLNREAAWYTTTEDQIMVKFQPQEGPPIAMGALEVTEADYSRFDPSRKASQFPVGDVSWDHAREYCNWLSLREDLEPCYIQTDENKWAPVPGWKERNGYRLPTRAEWREACRAGTVTARSFGASNVSWLDHFVWFRANSRGTKVVDGVHLPELKKVGLLRPNPFGFHDFLGNIVEISDGPPNQEGPCVNTGSPRLIRFDPPYDLPKDQSFLPEPYPTRGFRLAQTIPSN
ncbi:MAG: formylglycine-generating enzyme family protein, partial [Verrucomicrobiota bacterium]